MVVIYVEFVVIGIWNFEYMWLESCWCVVCVFMISYVMKYINIYWYYGKVKVFVFFEKLLKF